jgi:hypothetical protein
LAPSVFKKMLRILEPTIIFKGDEGDELLKERNGGLDLLREYIQDPTMIPKDLLSIQASLLKNPYQEMTWLFGRVVGQQCMTTISRLALYILHFTIHEKAIFDWEKIISRELSFQLSNLKNNKKFYMSSYLIFAITYCHVFKGPHLSKQVNSKFDHV